MPQTNRRLIWYLFPTFFLTTVLVLGAFAWIVVGHFHDFYLQHTIEGLQERARLLEPTLPGGELTEHQAALAAFCRNIADTHTRITIILPDGTVGGDSSADPEKMENHGSRPEIAAAMRGQNSWAIRTSKTVRESMLYAAVPLRQNGRICGVLRAAIPQTVYNAKLEPLYHKLMVAGFFMILLAGIASHLTAQYLMTPVQELVHGASTFGSGKLDAKIAIPKIHEFAELATCLNQMAGDLNERICIIERERNERDALFRSMAEGMIAIDMDERILSVNQAAEEILGIRAPNAIGRMLLEIIRHSELQAFVTQAMENGGTAEGSITFHGNEERNFHVHSTELYDFDGRQRGILIVLSDMTTLYRLERVRRDFVANVSHELRTPITSIRGCAETLHDNGSEKWSEGDRKFLQSILRQTARLEALINDLLDLSRIERQAEEHAVHKRTIHVNNLLENVRRGCEVMFMAKEITVSLHCDETLFVEGDEELLERALTNLLENAIKYSPEKSSVQLRAFRTDGQTFFQVEDNGPGIAEEHLPRLFERFYRADKARSRTLGGTGLGLSIVKHIAQLHGGTISVTSELEKGSQFEMILPPENPPS